jgi:hypothetical protein
MDNSGAVFKNDRKAEDRHPDYKGDAEVGGVKYWVSGWIKTAGPNAKNPGSKFMSLAFTVKDQQPAFAPPPANLGVDDDIPF